MILYSHDSSLILTTAQICNPSIYKTTSEPPKKMNHLSVLTKTEVSHSTSSISSMASEWWWFVSLWAVWPRRIVKLCHAGCSGTNHNVLVSAFFFWNIQYLPSLVVATCFLGRLKTNSFEDVVPKKSAPFQSSLNYLQVGLSGAIHQSLVSNSRRVEVQHPNFESSNLVFFFGRLLFWKKASLKVVHNLLNCSDFIFFWVCCFNFVCFRWDCCSIYHGSWKRYGFFLGLLVWNFEIFRWFCLLLQKDVTMFLVEETAELTNCQRFFFLNHDAAKSFSDRDISSVAIFFRMIPHRNMLFPTLNFSWISFDLLRCAMAVCCSTPANRSLDMGFSMFCIPSHPWNISGDATKKYAVWFFTERLGS